MYITRSQKRLSITIILSGLVVAGALLLRHKQQPTQPQAATNAAPIAAEPTRVPLPVTDQNHDGIPDWQESLVHTNVLDLSAATSSASSSNTVTDQISHELFKQIVEQNQAGIFAPSSQQIASDTAAALIAKANDPLMTTKDIVTSPNNATSALAAYGEAVAEIMQVDGSSSAANEVDIFTQAVKDQKPDELKPLDSKIAAYTKVIAATKQLAVPSSMTKQDLDLLNSYQAILSDIKAMRNGFNDPMLALIRLKRYQDDAKGLYNSIVNLYTTLVARGATWPSGSVVYTFIQIPNGQQ